MSNDAKPTKPPGSLVPPHIQEFNTIAGLIFAQLYKAFPGTADIDRQGIATAMGVEEDKLPSGNPFVGVLSSTISWLEDEGFMRSYGTLPAERARLTARGFSAMSTEPLRLTGTVGGELTKAIEQTPASKVDLGTIGDLIGGVFGGFTKSIMS
jgi:hypothetical protein